MIEGDSDKAKKELDNFIDYHKNISVKITEDKWIFDGMVRFIKTSGLPSRTEIILNTIIGFLQGKMNLSMLSDKVAVISDNPPMNNKLDAQNERGTITIEEVQDLSEGIVEIEEKISDLSTKSIPKVKEDLAELKEKVEDS